MAIVFPASPSVNDTFTEGSITYKWDGAKWIGLGLTPADRLVEGSNSLEINANNDLVWTGSDVGIGTNAPSSDGGTTLEIYNATTPTLKLNDGDDYKALLQLRGNDLEIRGSNGVMEFYTGSADGASSTERLRITSTGSAQFTGENSPSGRNTRISQYGSLLVATTDDIITSARCSIDAGNGNIATEGGLSVGGNVGVGIETPTGNFEVSGNDGINISNATRTGTSGAQWRLIPNSGGSNTNAATNLRLYEGVGAVEVLNIQKDGQVMLGHNELISHPNMDDLQIGDANGNRGLTICSGSSGFGSVCFGDSSDGSGNDRYRGFVEYYHGDDSLRLGTESSERFRIVKTTASVASTAPGSSGCGVVGINETDPAGDALALAVHAPYGMEDPRPLVYMKRSHGIGGGNGTDETVLHIDGTASYNSAGVIYGIKVNTKHNLNGSHYSGHFVNSGSQFAANGTSAVYVETHKLDTNGAGELIALHANGRITTTVANSGYSTAGFFQTGNNVNGRPIVCLQEYTANTFTHQIEFRKNNGSNIVSVGSIKSNNSATQYNTSSDYRLKENVVSLTGAIDRLKQLQPKRFNFIGDGETIDGFIAHEVSSIAPYAVSGEKDAMKTELVMSEDGKEQFDENGEIISKEVIDPQGVDYGKLSALTIAALQEAIAEIETLKGRLDAAGL